MRRMIRSVRIFFDAEEFADQWSEEAQAAATAQKLWQEWCVSLELWRAEISRLKWPMPQSQQVGRSGKSGRQMAAAGLRAMWLACQCQI